MSARFAKNVSQLCMATGYSRREFYRLRRMVGAPIPRSDGSHSIAAWRKFAKVARAKAGPTEKENLELLCLRQKAELQQLELSERRGEIEGEIHARYMNTLTRALGVFRSELLRMPDLLSPRFEAMSAREIHALWKGQLNEAFGRVHDALTNGRGAPGREKKVIQFERRAAA
jgi:hypothetical protein